MTSPPVRIRRAVLSDLSPIVRMLADDPLGARREQFVDPLPTSYVTAFRAIEQDQNNELVVAEAEDGMPVAVLQLIFTPHITHRGGWRATIEGVRVDSRYRGSGLGHKLFDWAVARARDRGCHAVQLTTDKQRLEAKRFYESLGFVASHEGMKIDLMVAPDPPTKTA